MRHENDIIGLPPLAHFARSQKIQADDGRLNGRCFARRIRGGRRRCRSVARGRERGTGCAQSDKLAPIDLGVHASSFHVDVSY
jgi:hypothetical protein